MRRRDLLVRIVGAVALGMTATGAQPAAPTVIGFLAVGSPGGDRDRLLDAFRRGLAESGFAEGRNLRIEYRWADEDRGRLPELAKTAKALGLAVPHSLLARADEVIE